MKKIIFSVALLNISLIFLVSAEPESLEKPKVLPELTREEHEKASSEGIKCDYILIDAILTNYPSEIDKKSLKDKDFKYVTKKDSGCRKEGKNFPNDCISKIETIIHKYFLTVNPEIYNNWQDCICVKNSNISSKKNSSANHHRAYGFCDENFTAKPISRLKS